MQPELHDVCRTSAFLPLFFLFFTPTFRTATMSDIIDDEKYTGTPDDKARAEHLEAQAGRLTDKEPFNRPAHYVDIDPVAEAKVRRKIDLRVVPLCTLLYL